MYAPARKQAGALTASHKEQIWNFNRSFHRRKKLPCILTAKSAYIPQTATDSGRYLPHSALLDGSVTMPAFGVSINEFTVNAMKSGIWVEFAYSSQQKSEGMEFEKLLVEVKPDYMGFNVNRYNSGYGYAGRCYYIDLRGKSMQSFYNFLCSELK
mgnify:CR=1 FL=1